jgi:hypothetical protein
MFLKPFIKTIKATGERKMLCRFDNMVRHETSFAQKYFAGIKEKQPY